MDTLTTRRADSGDLELLDAAGRVVGIVRPIERDWTPEEQAEAEANERWDAYCDWLRDQEGGE